WLTDFRYRGKNAYPLIDEWIEKHSEEYWAKDNFEFYDTQMSRAAIHQYKLFGLMPIGDTPRFAGWWYHTNLETKKSWYGSLGGFDSEIGWQRYLDKLGNNVREIEQAALVENLRVTDIFKPVQSPEQIVPIINSLVNDSEGTYQVNIPNKGPIIKGFPEDLVIECQGIVSGAGIRGVGVCDLPRKTVVNVMIERWRQAEAKIEALRSGDRDTLLVALLEDQRTCSLQQAETILDEWLADPRNERLALIFSR
ncbi:MAG: Alpha-glucosidase, partial [Bacilli bacterium]|nr:Alpha-glucosidase [Bacilli bacterium]